MPKSDTPKRKHAENNESPRRKRGGPLLDPGQAELGMHLPAKSALRYHVGTRWVVHLDGSLARRGHHQVLKDLLCASHSGPIGRDPS